MKNSTMVMMMAAEQDYVCIENEKLTRHSEDIAELKTRAEFKELRLEKLDEKIDDMDKKLDDLNDKLDKFVQNSMKDDNKLNQRVTALENTVKVLQWVTTLLFGSGIIWIIFTYLR